jgi:hypothetical protein
MYKLALVTKALICICLGSKSDHILGYDAMDLTGTLFRRNLLTPSADITALPNYTASHLSSFTTVRNSTLTNQDKAVQYILRILLDAIQQDSFLFPHHERKQGEQNYSSPHS